MGVELQGINLSNKYNIKIPKDCVDEEVGLRKVFPTLRPNVAELVEFFQARTFLLNGVVVFRNVSGRLTCVVTANAHARPRIKIFEFFLFFFSYIRYSGNRINITISRFCFVK